MHTHPLAQTCAYSRCLGERGWVRDQLFWGGKQCQHRPEMESEAIVWWTGQVCSGLSDVSLECLGHRACLWDPPHLHVFRSWGPRSSMSLEVFSGGTASPVWRRFLFVVPVIVLLFKEHTNYFYHSEKVLSKWPRFFQFYSNHKVIRLEMIKTHNLIFWTSSLLAFL